MDKKKSKEELDRINRVEQEKKIIMAMVGVFVVIILVALVFSFVPGSENNSDYSNPYEVVGSELLIPLSDVSTSAKYYSYDTGDEDVKFFVVEGSDGQVHTAFDACDVCWQEEKGYEQTGSKMRCRNCGNQYSTNQIGTANQGGGCWPGYMQQTISDGYLKISLSELNRGERYFP
jgi:uncharacterized membrane protein